ncbi:MAG: lytic transglycosylase domain-containing protein [Alphaproteobacteria bacterium]|nr:lytic transglycosylase domain-containing protein [Alphaproteobacteria bacterium]
MEEDFACLDATVQAEEKYQIQKHLLTSISNVETGRWSERLQQITAWPWSVNVGGKGYFYSSKEEAIAAVKSWQQKGYKSIDVGCMQVNLHFHGKEFADLEDAFDPKKNVETAAKILTRRFQVRKDWMQAATDYHSTLPHKARAYKKKLLLALDDAKTGSNRYLADYAGKLLAVPESKNWFPQWLESKQLIDNMILSSRG